MDVLSEGWRPGLQLDFRGAMSLPGEAAVIVTKGGGRVLEHLTIMSYVGSRKGDEVDHAFTVRDEKGRISRRSAADLGLIDCGERITFYAVGTGHAEVFSVA